MPEVDNNVLVERLEGLTKLINEKFETNSDQHSKIEAQVVKTNGRVNSLEDWKNRIVGAIIIMNIVFLPIIFMVVNNWLR
ncbi:MAG: hypothetical protein WC619_01850 [Patescibacteria group bacterium]